MWDHVRGRTLTDRGRLRQEIAERKEAEENTVERPETDQENTNAEKGTTLARYLGEGGG